MSNATLSREDILAEIARLETRLFELRLMIPSPMKKFYRFRCRPERFVMIYAADETEARARLNKRMEGYAAKGIVWELVSQVVDVYADPEDAALQASGSIFQELTPMEAVEFFQHFKDNQRGRAPENPIKKGHKTRLVCDVEKFEKFLNLNPGWGKPTTNRAESDTPKLLSGASAEFMNSGPQRFADFPDSEIG